jgi:hypothetical protein
MKTLYRPLSLAASILGGIVAGAVFKKIWQSIADEDQAPTADQPDRGWKEVATAAAIQGAVTGGVKAIVDRGALKGFERATGVWAGEEATSSK